MTGRIIPEELKLSLIGDDERGYDFITEKDILALKALTSDQGILSLYMDIRPEQLQNNPLGLRYKSLIAQARASIDDRNALKLFDAVVADIGKLLENNYSRPRGRGLAIFAAPKKFSPKRDRAVKYEKFLVYHLPEAPADTLAWGTTPALTPLLIQLDEHEPTGVVLADRRRARFFIYYMGEAAEYSISEVDETPPKTKALGWGAHNHEQWLEEQYRKHLRNIAAFTEMIAKKAGWKWLVLAGPDEIPAELSRYLSKTLKDKLLAPTALSLDATYNDIRDKVAPLVQEAEAREETQILETFVGEMERESGRAVAGLADTTLAAQQARIGVLIFPPDLRYAGWQCQSCGGLMADLTAAPPEQCVYCGGPLKEIPDIVTVAALQTLNLGGHVEVVRNKENQAVIKTHGGIGALLRY